MSQKCEECQYFHVRQYGEDDFGQECDPPDEECPYHPEQKGDLIDGTNTHNKF